MKGTLIFTIILAAAIAAASPDGGNSSHVRQVTVTKDQIVLVRTSIGIATLLQVPDRPTSAIIGDQQAFKLEYLDNGVTIKPLQMGARTNLYIYTDSQRFNVHLIPAPKEVADYIVYLKNVGGLPQTQSENKIKWRSYARSDSKSGVTLKISKLGSTGRSGFWLINFEIQSDKETQLKPEWFWIIQNKGYRPIHSLYLSGLKSGPDQSIRGTITLRQIDLIANTPIRLEVRFKKNLSIQLPEVALWLR